MTAFEDILHSIAPELKELNERMRHALHTSNPLMNEIVSNYLTTKGKQIRPVMVLLSAKLFGGINSTALHGAAAIEMLHNASLIHDDVVDDSSQRHGQETINAMWDNHVAVLVGDFFVSNALRLAARTADLRVINTIADLGKLLSLGEMDQIYNARYHELNEEAYFKVISHKTASLFVSCVAMGGYCTGADDESIEAMRRFAELFGLCFQIKDDIFDYFDSKAIGKPTGNDLREGKVTLPLLHALNSTTGPESEAMKALLRSGEPLSEEEIDSLIAFARANGGIEYAYATMQRLREEAAAILRRFDSPVTAHFLSLFDFIISREV